MRTVIGSLLLGIGLLCPSFLLWAIFPISAQMQKDTLTILAFPISAMLLHAFLGPLIEELIYRGLFLQLLRRYMSVWVAVGISSVIFALTHVFRGPGNVLVAGAMSILISWLFLRSGSLIPGYVCHVVFNYAAMFVVWPIGNISGKVLAVAPGSTLPMGDVLPAWWIAISLILIAVSVPMLRREFARSKAGLDANVKLSANVA